MAVRTERFKYSKDFPVDEINRFFEDNAIDRTQIIATGVVQLSTNSMAYFVTYEDVIAPYVVGISPPDGASSVIISTPIIIQFSEALKSPVGPTDFSLTRDGADVDLTGLVSLAGSVVTIAAGAIDGTYGASYVLTVKTSIKDLNGNPMAQPKVTSWVTQSSTSSLVQKAGRVAPSNTDIANGYSNVVFSTSMPNDAYRLSDPSFHHSVLFPIGWPSGVTPFRITNKVAAGFRINFDAPFPTGAAVEWLALWGAPS